MITRSFPFSAFMLGMLMFGMTSTSHADSIRDALRSVQNASRTARDGVATYKSVRSIAVPVIAKRTDSVAVNPNQVVLYSTARCGYCVQARKHMRSRQVDFVEFDIEQDTRGYADYQALNGRGVPILLLGQERMNGWDASGFDRMFKVFKESSPPVGNTASTGGRTVTAADAASVGDVLVAKIDNVALYADPAVEAQIVARLKKGEELVALGKADGNRIEVQAAFGVGYVDARLVGPARR